MILDIAILIIFAVPVVMGLRRGFIYMVVRTFGWIGAIVCACLLTEPLADIMENGFIGAWISESIAEKLASPLNSAETAADGLPDMISGELMSTAEEASSAFVSAVTSLVVSVLSFLLIVFFVRLLVRYITNRVGRKRRGGILSRTDKLLGMAAGCVEGFLLVMLLLTLLVPVAGMGVGDGTSAAVCEQLEESLLAGYLYDNNFLLSITGSGV